MIATIVCSIIFVIGVLIFIFALLECENGWATAGLMAVIISIVVVAISLWVGYSEPHHDYAKEEIINALVTDPNRINIEEAERWNRREKDGNNLWCRFELRDEDLIDVYQILIDYRGGEGK